MTMGSYTPEARSDNVLDLELNSRATVAGPRCPAAEPRYVENTVRLVVLLRMRLIS